MAVITPDIIEHVARLARLSLEGQALSQLAAELDEILQYVQQLQSVPTDHVEPTSHVLPLANVLRKDEPCPSLSQEDVVGIAPARRAGFVAVPKVLES